MRRIVESLTGGSGERKNLGGGGPICTISGCRVCIHGDILDGASVNGEVCGGGIQLLRIGTGHERVRSG